MSLLVRADQRVWRECRQGAQRVGGHLGREAVGLRDLPVDLLAVDRDLAGRLEAQPDRAAADLHDVDLDVLADPDALADVAGECEHWSPPWVCVAIRGTPRRPAGPCRGPTRQALHNSHRRPDRRTARPAVGNRGQRRKSISVGWRILAVTASEAW